MSNARLLPWGAPIPGCAGGECEGTSEKCRTKAKGGSKRGREGGSTSEWGLGRRRSIQRWERKGFVEECGRGRIKGADAADAAKRQR
ncbi:uncharacterized protein EI97DRAFT_252147 [Westerdykella ornata]|uniref:Uncharacterized protein n=1 Tax=Westerdykella ornata TaxID=318751 RepID=A0A6A6JQ63_WESOR|nr:uncharacterized protein EI97DRAFT_252147 [Westerdykella ornata]KAF2278394.1 hypothetical protein EI97DRAFT_252147 [Westerdykella ornata]